MFPGSFSFLIEGKFLVQSALEKRYSQKLCIKLVVSLEVGMRVESPTSFFFLVSGLEVHSNELLPCLDRQVLDVRLAD